MHTSKGIVNHKLYINTTLHYLSFTWPVFHFYYCLTLFFQLQLSFTFLWNYMTEPIQLQACNYKCRSFFCFLKATEMVSTLCLRKVGLANNIAFLSVNMPLSGRKVEACTLATTTLDSLQRGINL